MKSSESKMVLCQISGKKVPIDLAVPTETLTPFFIKRVKEALPNWDGSPIYISITEMIKLHSSGIRALLVQEAQRISETGEKVDIGLEVEEDGLLTSSLKLHYGIGEMSSERLADNVAKIGGSWGFVALFVITVLLWIALNTMFIIFGVFDPYPYAVLGLLLAFVATIEVPIILMSQNRKAKIDRRIEINNHLINLQSELEVGFLNEKLTCLFIVVQTRMSKIESELAELESKIAKYVVPTGTWLS